MRLEDTVCVVTGASGGIGRALVTSLCAAGARPILAGRDRHRLDALAAELPDGRVAGICAGDLTTVTAQNALAELAERRDARVLVNLAGRNDFALLMDQPRDVTADLVTTNLIAPIQLTQRLLPHLSGRPEAMVVNVGSAFGALGFPGYALYCASKFGLRGFSEALARELADRPVHVIYVAPRATRTAMNAPAASAMNAALGNAEDLPEQVAVRVVDAMRRNRRRTGIGRAERLFVRVNQLAPGVVDRALARQLPVIRAYASSPQQEEPSS